MKKILCLVVSLAMLGISGCDVVLGPDSPVGMGTLSIGFGEDSGNRGTRSVSEETQATLRYDLVLTGPDRQKITASLAVGHTFNGQVALGEWLIEAKAFTPENTLFGAGSTTITVRAGANQARVSMTASADIAASALDLTALVAAPERGATPNATAINEPQYTGTITWDPAHSLFAPSTAYQATVSLTATAGYTFAGLSADSFIYTYAGATAVNPAGSGNTLTVTISFPETAPPGENTVSARDLTALVAVPVKSATPATEINTPQYTGTITWDPAHSLFAPSTAYQATVSLTATAGYTFAGLSADSFIYTYAGATAVNPAGSGNTITATISFPATAAPGENTVSDIDLTALVSAPVRGATPDATPISIAQYAGTIIWNPAHSTFAPSTAYQAVVSLIATTGYTFTGVVANSFSHSGAETITNPAGSGNTITVTISFPATAAPGENTVSDLNLTALVIAPVKGATPNTAAINEPQYTGAITWTPAHSLFAPSTAYQAEVVLIAKAGHTFAGVSAGSFSHTHTGTTTTNPAGSEKTITVTISFPATAADMVSAFDLTSLVAAPVKGATPATAINAPQYTGAITWTPAHSTFAPSTAYQAAVVLTATTGHTFAGVGAGSFSHSGAATMTNPTGSGNTLTVTINFPATAADVVNAFDLTFLAAAPVKGATPAMAINAPQYTGIITWTPAHSTFAPSTTYQAEVVLMATTGHTFVGVGAGSFSHTYAGTTISNTVGSGNTITVTISFPATADPEHTITVDPDAGEGALSQETFTVSKGDGESETVNIIGSDYTNPRWFVDGDLLDETGTSVTIGAADYSVGKHNLTLLITKSGVSWSKEITFTVTN